jgi:hypothetical protein
MTRASNHSRPASGHSRPASSHNRPASSHSRPASNHSRPASNHSRPATNQSRPANGNGGEQPRVLKQPLSKQQAATQHGMFLYTDDAWSQAYFKEGDLHYLERLLFGKAGSS